MTITTTRVDRANRASLVGFAIIGGGVVLATLVFLVTRILEIAPNVGVPVEIPLVDQATTLPIGPDGADVAVDAETVTVTASGLAGATVFSLVAEAATVAAMTIGVTVCAVIVCLNIARRSVFERTNARLLSAAALILIIGEGVATLFRTMGTNGTLAVVSGGDYAGFGFTINPLPWLAGLAVSAIALAFETGHRLQRDTEGLV